MSLAPIVLFTFNRPSHTARVLDALRVNAEAAHSELVVFCDGPRGENDNVAVDEVRRLIRNIQGFKKVTVIERQKNLGLANSIVEGVNQVCASYGRAIVVEDDILVSPHFLDYVNKALQLYEEDERVLSIGCYTFPVSDHLPETFFLKLPDCWGWAVWKRSWDLFESDGSKLLAEIRDRDMEHEFDLEGAYPYTRMLVDQTLGKNHSWAIRWYAKAFLLDKLTLYPGRSMTRNIGMDGSGVHCGLSNQYEVEIASESVSVYPIPIEEHAEARAVISAFLSRQHGSLAQRIRATVSGFLARR